MNSHFNEEDVQMENKPTTRYSTSLAIPGTEEPGRRLSMGSHRVGNDWSDLAAAAAIRETQIKTIMSYRFTSVRIAKIKNNDNTKYWWGCRETIHSYVVSRDIKWHSHSGKQSGSFLQS